MSTSSDDTELHSLSINRSFESNRDAAQFVEEILEILEELQTSIITIRLANSGQFYAATVTIESSEDIRTLTYFDELPTT